ncbi:MAG: integrase arm-type DNA-binding domain-containing protein [Alphaproteobacteria bacterium]
MPLTDVKVRSAKPAAKPYKLYDSNGLFVFITPSGNKLWRLKYIYLKKERLCAIGAYPSIGLKEARETRDNLKKLIAQGIDPIQQRRNIQRERFEASQQTLEALTRRWLEIKSIDAEHRARSLRRMELHAFPKLGFRPIHEITTVELVSCLEAVERKGVLETAHRVKQVLQQVFRYAVRKGLIVHNPAGDLRDMLAFPEKNNFACINPEELPKLLKDMNAYNGSTLTRLGMRMLALTFVRTGELRAACWDEIDWARAEWRIPASRMKMRRDHIVPLARQTLSILEELKAKTGRQVHIFHAPANKLKYLSEGAILGALRRMGYGGHMTGHGFRSLASTILNEQRIYHPDIIEKQLAHADRNEIRAAYNRADYLLERKKMMQDWADYLDRALADQDNIIQGRFKNSLINENASLNAAE